MCLDRKLYSPADVAAGLFAINDDPALAEAIIDQGALLGCADASEETHTFFSCLKLPLLTTLAGEPEPRIGEERTAPAWFKPAQTLDRLHSQDFASALAAISRVHSRTGSTVGPAVTALVVSARLATIVKVAIVQDLELVYRIGPSRVSVRKDVWLAEERICLTRVTSHRGLDLLLAEGLAPVLSEAAGEQQRLADTIYYLLTCGSSEEMAGYLRRRGIPWEPSSNDVSGVGDEEEAEHFEVPSSTEAVNPISEAVRRMMERATSALRAAQQRTAGPNGHDEVRETQPAVGQAAPPPLPPIDEVTLQEIPSPSNWTPPERRESTSGGGGGGWFPHTQAARDRDEAVGRRGEELVYLKESERVRQLGMEESKVVWTAQHDRTADHDILSVDEDGADLWIEVKSTTGRDGRFEWSAAEFEKAIREGMRYELWRVYEADTAKPTYKRFRDPMSLLRAHRIRMDLASFRAEVEPMDQ